MELHPNIPSRNSELRLVANVPLRKRLAVWYQVSLLPGDLGIESTTKRFFTNADDLTYFNVNDGLSGAGWQSLSTGLM